MNNVIKLHIGNKNHSVYSADIYSEDMKKYQLQVIAGTISSAIRQVLEEVLIFRIKVVKCLAIYEGSLQERKAIQAPINIWLLDELDQKWVKC